MNRQGEQKEAKSNETFQKQRIVVTVSGSSWEVKQTK